jgi:hypothetical protein
MMHVLLLHAVSLSLANQSLQLLNGILRGGGDVHVLHLEAQVALTDESLATLVDLLNEGGLDDDAKLLGLFEFLIEHLHALADRLVVVDVGHTLNEVLDIKLFLQFEMQDLGLVEQLHIDVGLGGLDLREDLV